MRFRTATTQAGLMSATWSPVQDGIEADGTISFDMATFCATDPGYNAGTWIAIELTLRTS